MSGSADGRRLVAYLVLEPGARPGRREMREFLRSKLPSYEVPARFVALEELPRTPGGKLDLGSLARGGAGTELEDRESVAPRTRTESLLLDIWRQVLRVETPGVDDNFFELGGNSLLLLDVAERARRAGLELDAAALLHHQTIAGLARSLEERS